MNRPLRLRVSALETEDDTIGGNLAVLQSKVGSFSAFAMGRATLVLGTVTVAHPATTANSNILAFCEIPGGTPAALRVSARTAGVGFTITSLLATDTSTVAWFRFEP